MNTPFPSITVPGSPVNAKDHVEPGTGLYLVLAFLCALAGSVFLIAVSYGVLLVAALFYPLFLGYLNKKAMALLNGSGVRVSESQFPEIHRALVAFKERLGITRDVAVYIVEANVLNAASIKYGRRDVVTITDDLIQGCLASGNPQALSFVLAHELGHIALRHTGVFRRWMTRFLKKLSRL
ncbi:MAG TPA: M48 family metalloprotease, partial [bacterium]|nr:M48 family metalloprotease [bacterium]